MGLLDLFRPKWKHSDYLLAREYVENLDPIRDFDLLFKIAETKCEAANIAELKISGYIFAYILLNYRQVLLAANFLEKCYENDDDIFICILFSPRGEYEYRDAK